MPYIQLCILQLAYKAFLLYRDGIIVVSNSTIIYAEIDMMF